MLSERMKLDESGGWGHSRRQHRGKERIWLGFFFFKFILSESTHNHIKPNIFKWICRSV
jgi:hypothetical protein